jgi:hypothetical protein
MSKLTIYSATIQIHKLQHWSRIHKINYIQSPIVIGTRILREKNREDFLGKENRSLLANYMAAVNAGVTKLAAGSRASPRPEPDAKPDPVSRLTLQEALALKRPDFVDRANFRRQRLGEMKAKRLEYEEQVTCLRLHTLANFDFIFLI